MHSSSLCICYPLVLFFKYNIHYHCYADDTQFYLPVNTEGIFSLENIFNCLKDIKSWMARHFLQLNESKTDIIIFGPPNDVSSLKNALGSLSANCHSEVKNLWVFFDSSLNCTKQVNSVVKSSFFQNYKNYRKTEAHSVLHGSWDPDTCFHHVKTWLLQLTSCRSDPLHSQKTSASSKRSS